MSFIFSLIVASQITSADFDLNSLIIENRKETLKRNGRESEVSLGQGKEGGDPLGILFSSFIYESLNKLRKYKIYTNNKFQDLNLELLEMVNKKINVTVVDYPIYTILKGEKVQVTALSHLNTFEIKISREKISDMNKVEWELLAFHELMVLAGYELTSDYFYSSQYQKLLDVSKTSFFCISRNDKQFKGKLSRKLDRLTFSDSVNNDIDFDFKESARYSQKVSEKGHRRVWIELYRPSQPFFNTIYSRVFKKEGLGHSQLRGLFYLSPLSSRDESELIKGENLEFSYHMQYKNEMKEVKHYLDCI